MKLDAAQIAQFEEEGYLLLHGVLTDADLDPVIAEYEQHIDRRAHELLTEGKISKLYADEPFHRRLVSICRECDEIYSNLDIMHFRGRDSFEFLRNDHLLDIVEGLVGPEITCSPVQHTRAKLPQGLTPSDGDPHIAPWHQDAGAFVEAADPHFVLTVWLPLSEARPENGCMQIIPRVHTEGLQQHWIERGLVTMSVEDERLREEGLTMPMDKGDVLLMHKAVPIARRPTTPIRCVGVWIFATSRPAPRRLVLPNRTLLCAAAATPPPYCRTMTSGAGCGSRHWRDARSTSAALRDGWFANRQLFRAHESRCARNISRVRARDRRRPTRVPPITPSPARIRSSPYPAANR